MTGSLQEKHGPGTPPAFERLSEGAFHGQIAASPGVSVVLFTAPQCGSCRAWRAVLPDALQTRVRRYVEVDVSEATGIARYYGIFHLPAIHLYVDGQFHAEVRCPARRADIRAAVAALLAAPAQEEP